MKRKLYIILALLLTVIQGAWAEEITQWTFSYTGAIQTFTAPYAGIYELRVWGAQGGDRTHTSGFAAGGLGGYATCRTNLMAGETIYIYVGGQGGTVVDDNNRPAGAGGWNGGGDGGNGVSGHSGSAGGGGATHISKVDNQVIGNGCNFLGGTNYIIVAGGGGGAGHNVTTAGAGGGTEGGRGTSYANQTAGEYGTTWYYSSSDSRGAQGGHGLVDGNTACEGAGGGGGGYLGGNANFAYETFTSAYQDAGGCGGNSSYNSGLATNFSTTAGLREGNGQAQITLLLQGSGTSSSPYLITSTSDWNKLANHVNSGTNYSGKYFRLTNNISVTTMVGNSVSNSFCGTFDGDGHTLTISYNTTSDYTAPFRYIQGATFKKLKVTGSITTTMNYAAGIAGLNTSAEATFDQCVTDVTINSSSTTATDWDTYDYHGGLLARTNSANVSITDCVCGGSVDGSSSTKSYCASFVGVAVSSVVSATSCLSTTSYSNVSAVNSLCHSDGATRSASVFYYVNGNDGASPGTHISLSDLNDGTYATALQAGRGTKVWVQDPHTNQPMLVLFVEKTATLNQATDNSSFISTNNGLVYDITLTRTLQTGGWNTFCIPFSISSAQITSIFGEGTKVRELGSSDFNNTTKALTLNFTNATSIVAGKPYLVKVTSAVENPTFNDVTIVNGTTTKTTTYADFVPVMNPTAVTGGDKSILFVSGGDKLTYPSSDGSIKGFRAYFKLQGDAAASARSFEMSFDDETDGLKTLSNSPLKGENIYNLAGQRLQKMQRGINIVNGRKVVIK